MRRIEVEAGKWLDPFTASRLPMRIDAHSECISISAPAKLNLFLEVLGKRDDGFHEIETVMCPIALFDRLAIETTSDPQVHLEVTCPQNSPTLDSPTTGGEVREGEAASDPAWEVPASPSNLVFRAARRVQEELGTTAGCRIKLEKQVPASAGLGGGSSDAAATVVACLHLWDRWDRELATRICAELGSDIPFFLGDETGIGLALATGRGERFKLLSATPALEFVVLHPPVGCATGEIYGAYRSSAETRSAARILAACESGQSQKIGAELFNALQFPAVRLNAWIARQLELLADCGFDSTSMTGSGSSCFAVVDHHSSRLDDVTSSAIRKGIDRVYSATAWYAESIEGQLESQ